jgi:UDP-3-O-[3-hydroxymyristoyl] glucosamine N-acyltransferase
MNAGDVIAVLGDQVVRTVGSLDRAVTRPAALGAADPSAISFCSPTGDEGRHAIAASTAGTIVCAEMKGLEGLAEEKTLLIVDQPRLAFLRMVDQLFSAPRPEGIHSSAIIEKDARIGPDVAIGAHSYVGSGVEVGAGTVIHANATVHEMTKIGRNAVIWSGAVIGLDGFGFHRNQSGQLERFPHIGGVTIEDDVELGANTIVARGTFADTVIRRGAKVDCFVHVAHNVVIGEAAVVIAHAMLGGSVHVGARAWIAPCACIRDGIKIGDDATVGLGAVVVKDVEAGATVMGAPARDATEFKRMLDSLRNLSQP